MTTPTPPQRAPLLQLSPNISLLGKQREKRVLESWRRVDGTSLATDDVQDQTTYLRLRFPAGTLGLELMPLARVGSSFVGCCVGRVIRAFCSLSASDFVRVEALLRTCDNLDDAGTGGASRRLAIAQIGSDPVLTWSYEDVLDALHERHSEEKFLELRVVDSLSSVGGPADTQSDVLLEPSFSTGEKESPVETLRVAGRLKFPWPTPIDRGAVDYYRPGGRRVPTTAVESHQVGNSESLGTLALRSPGLFFTDQGEVRKDPVASPKSQAFSFPQSESNFASEPDRPVESICNLSIAPSAVSSIVRNKRQGSETSSLLSESFHRDACSAQENAAAMRGVVAELESLIPQILSIERHGEEQVPTAAVPVTQETNQSSDGDSDSVSMSDKSEAPSSQRAVEESALHAEDEMLLLRLALADAQRESTAYQEKINQMEKQFLDATREMEQKAEASAEETAMERSKLEDRVSMHLSEVLELRKRCETMERDSVEQQSQFENAKRHSAEKSRENEQQTRQRIREVEVALEQEKTQLRLAKESLVTLRTQYNNVTLEREKSVCELRSDLTSSRVDVAGLKLELDILHHRLAAKDDALRRASAREKELLQTQEILKGAATIAKSSAHRTTARLAATEAAAKGQVLRIRRQLSGAGLDNELAGETDVGEAVLHAFQNLDGDLFRHREALKEKELHIRHIEEDSARRTTQVHQLLAELEQRQRSLDTVLLDAEKMSSQLDHAKTVAFRHEISCRALEVRRDRWHAEEERLVHRLEKSHEAFEVSRGELQAVKRSHAGLQSQLKLQEQTLRRRTSAMKELRGSLGEEGSLANAVEALKRALHGESIPCHSRIAEGDSESDVRELIKAANFGAACAGSAAMNLWSIEFGKFLENLLTLLEHVASKVSLSQTETQRLEQLNSVSSQRIEHLTQRLAGTQATAANASSSLQCTLSKVEVLETKLRISQSLATQSTRECRRITSTVVEMALRLRHERDRARQLEESANMRNQSIAKVASLEATLDSYRSDLTTAVREGERMQQVAQALREESLRQRDLIAVLKAEMSSQAERREADKMQANSENMEKSADTKPAAQSQNLPGERSRTARPPTATGRRESDDSSRLSYRHVAMLNAALEGSKRRCAQLEDELSTARDFIRVLEDALVCSSEAFDEETNRSAKERERLQRTVETERQLVKDLRANCAALLDASRDLRQRCATLEKESESTRESESEAVSGAEQREAQNFLDGLQKEKLNEGGEDANSDFWEVSMSPMSGQSDEDDDGVVGALLGSPSSL